MSFTVNLAGKEIVCEHKTTILNLLEGQDPEKRIVAARVNNRTRELTYEISKSCSIELLDCSSVEAMKIYEASLRYITAMAFHRCYPDLRVRFAYNVSRAISIHILNHNVVATGTMLRRVQEEMKKIIEADYPLLRKTVSVAEAKEIYEKAGDLDKIEILKYRPEATAHLYCCEGYVDYMYNRMVVSTGYIHDFKLRLYSPGMLLQYPRAEEGGNIPEFEDAPTFHRTLAEAHDWSKTVNSSTISGLNHELETRGDVDYLNLCEARHNRMLCELGELIQSDIENIRLICIAGPSSSGKTTFANRLRIELMSRGIRPIRISLDDYYLSRDQMPLDEKGEKDFESIEGLDIPRFNQNMLDLISGEEVTLPVFDFAKGQSIPGRTLKLSHDQPIIIEGIHALNDRLHGDISKGQKFKIFIAPQAQINIDDHSPISLTDLRLVRRIVRDYQFRASPAIETLEMWPSVRAGEFKWIYPFQEGCDYVFNSFLPYELPLMKKYAMPLLQGIEKDSPYYPTALRLMRMLKFFVDMPERWIPSNSLIREFIGGSCYADV